MLQVNNLHIQFKTNEGVFEAVKNISFNLQKGQTIGIVGESGSGKSVTSLAIMRLLDEKQAVINGEVILEDVNLFGLSEDEMRRIRGNRIAMIF